MSRGMARANTLGGAGAPGGRSAKRKGGENRHSLRERAWPCEAPLPKGEDRGARWHDESPGQAMFAAGVGFVRKAHAKIEGRNRRRAMDAAS